MRREKNTKKKQYSTITIFQMKRHLPHPYQKKEELHPPCRYHQVQGEYQTQVKGNVEAVSSFFVPLMDGWHQ